MLGAGAISADCSCTWTGICAKFPYLLGPFPRFASNIILTFLRCDPILFLLNFQPLNIRDLSDNRQKITNIDLGLLVSDSWGGFYLRYASEALQRYPQNLVIHSGGHVPERHLVLSCLKRQSYLGPQNICSDRSYFDAPKEILALKRNSTNFAYF